jgi:hypothetical protein
MTDETTGLRFERDLRAMLAASEPADVPASLYATVGAIPRPAPGVVAPPARQGWDRRALAVLAAAAVLAIVAVGIGSGIVHLPGILPQVGGPTAAPHTQTYRLYYEVTPLDRHTPMSDELQRALDVLKARAAAYQGTATGEVLADIPNTVAVDVTVPADDPGRLEELRAVLPIEGGLTIGTMNDGPIEIGASADGRDFEPALGSGSGFTPTLRPDGSALDLAVEPGIFAQFSEWANAHPGGTGVITTSDGLVLALAPIAAPAEGGSWTIPFTPDQVAAGTPRKLLALFSSSSLQNPVREVAPRGETLAPGITPEPVPTPSPTVDPADQVRLEYRLVTVGVAPTADEVAAVIKVLRKRVEAAGIPSPSVEAADAGSIVMVAAIRKDDYAATMALRQILAATGRLDFVPLGDTPASQGEHIDLTALPPLFSGDQVASAKVGADQTGSRTVEFVLKPAAKALFADHTANHIGQYFAITVDGTVLTAPVINSSIPGGEIQISGGGVGGFAQDEALALVALVGSGPLPTPIEEVSSNVENRAPAPTASPAPTTLSVAGYADGCTAPGGCTYSLQLRSADAEWQAALAIDAAGQASAGAGLPATLDPGDYTVTATARRNPDSIGGGIGDPGPVDATCTANFTVAQGDDVMVVSATFGTGACTVSAGVPQ